MIVLRDDQDDSVLKDDGGKNDDGEHDDGDSDDGM